MPINKTLTEQERNYYYNAIQALDEKSEYVICDSVNDTLSYTEKIKSHERISGRPVDEELTRALIVVNLICRYGYHHTDLELEVSVEVSGREIKKAVFQNDIALKNDKGEYIGLIEVKRITDFQGVNDELIRKQLFHPYENFTQFSSVNQLYYVSCDIPLDAQSFPLICIGINTEKTGSYDEWSKRGKPAYYIDILQKSGEQLKYDNYRKSTGDTAAESLDRDLNDSFSVDTVRRIWRNIWDAIWGGTLESNTKFENFNKILVAKIYDERKTTPGSYYRFQRKIKAGEVQSNADLAADIDLLYRKAYLEYFCKNKNTDLKDVKGIDFEQFSPALTARCVEELYRYSFAGNRFKNVDILGEFYEMVIRDSFKQTKGLFLTHPNLVLFILEALNVEELVSEKLCYPDEDARFRLPFVIDPSCGTGTFLVYYMNLVQRFVDKNSDQIANGDIDVEDFIKREVQGQNTFKWVKDYVFGIDCEPVLAMASQINQILHGDGSTNIYCADGLDSFENYKQLDITGARNILSSCSERLPYYPKDCIEKFDLIISNPPFNVNIDKTFLSDRFEISGKSEAYFLERWYQLLKPKGRLGVVLPESFFSVEDDSNGRVFLYKHFNIKCIVSLPGFTFLPHTPTNTSLLFAQKKSVDQEKEFHQLWVEKSNLFEKKYDLIVSQLPKKKTVKDEGSLSRIFDNICQSVEKEYGEGFMIFPYFGNEFLSDTENYNSLKKKIKDVILSSKERWVLNEVFDSLEDGSGEFKNYAVNEIGYKAGKKGAKDRPNELMTIIDSCSKQIYNLKYAHDWDRVNTDDLNTVLGLIRRDIQWQ